MASPSVGFFALVALLSLKVVGIAIESRGILQWNLNRLATHLRAVATVMGFFILVLGMVTFSRMNDTRPEIYNHCQDADADIVGDGVRIAAWLQVVILGLIAACGSFHYDPTAAQEVGAGLLVTHVALAIALLVPMVWRSLSPIDAVLGAMVLDAQNVALSVQLVTKATLASRWQTATVIFGQLAGLVAIGFLVDRFQRNLLSTDVCECLSVFWWGWFSNCSGLTPNEISTFWIYYALRCVTLVHCSLISALSTQAFHRAEKREAQIPGDHCRETKPTEDATQCEPKCKTCLGCPKCNKKICNACDDCEPCKQWRLCIGYGHLPPDQRKPVERNGLVGGRTYSNITSSASLMYIEYSLYALFSSSAAESMMATHKIRPSSEIHSVGQITAIVIAGGTAIRAFWVTAFMFWQKSP